MKFSIKSGLAISALCLLGLVEFQRVDGFLQIQTPQNPLLSESEITQYEVYFAALKKISGLFALK